MKSTKGTKTLTIGGVCANIKSTDLVGNFIDCVSAVDFDVTVEYTYQPGRPNDVFGAVEDAEEGYDEELCIKSIKPVGRVSFAGSGWEITAERGTELKDLFSHVEMCCLEDRVLAEIKEQQ